MTDELALEPLPDLTGLRILIVEDTFLIADLLAEQLIECGCEVVGPASRVATGATLARTETFNGALLDVNLAGEYSFPIARILQERGLPFAFLTGYTDDLLPSEYRESPHLTKPFNLRDLVTLVSAMIGSERD